MSRCWIYALMLFIEQGKQIILPGLGIEPGNLLFFIYLLKLFHQATKAQKTRQIFFRTKKIIGRGLYSKTFYGRNLWIFMIG